MVVLDDNGLMADDFVDITPFVGRALEIDIEADGSIWWKEEEIGRVGVPFTLRGVATLNAEITLQVNQFTTGG